MYTYNTYVGSTNTVYNRYHSAFKIKTNTGSGCTRGINILSGCDKEKKMQQKQRIKQQINTR